MFKSSRVTVHHRSAVTGRYVTANYVKSHPKTTVRETDKKSNKLSEDSKDITPISSE